MQNDILQVIEKNLPLEVGKTLQKRLQEADTERQELLKIKQDHENLKEALEKVKAENQLLLSQKNVVLEQARVNEQKEKSLYKSEVSLEKTLAQAKAEEVEKRNGVLLEVVKLAFKSPVYKKSVSENASYNSYYSNAAGTQIYSDSPSNKYKTEEIIEE